jgi:hypothetical protein
MFITSIKVTKQKLIAAVAIAGLVLVGLIVLIAVSGGDRGQAASALPSVKNIKTEKNRVDFLPSCGWQVSLENAQCQEVLIPGTFDEVFLRYNEMQKAEGFDLMQLRNKRVMRYTYTVTNYPNGEDGVQATLLIYKDKIVGGDICSTRMGGFMHGFMYPAQ